MFYVIYFMSMFVVLSGLGYLAYRKRKTPNPGINSIFWDEKFFAFSLALAGTCSLIPVLNTVLAGITGVISISSVIYSVIKKYLVLQD